MDDPWGDHAIPVKFEKIADSLEKLQGLAIDGVAAVGDEPAILAAAAAEMLGVPFHPPAAARACHDKFLARELFQAAGMRLPQFFRVPLSDDPRILANTAGYPCVLKPLGLSASRGVIRANDPAGFVAAFERILAMLSRQDFIQIESYIPGREFAVEGLVTAGEFEPLAIFDKPDPLEGPFFEETIYVTPSREPSGVQQELLECTARAVRALGLRHGPVHAELRYNDEGAWILEAAARPIGGLCARTLRFTGGASLEEAIIRHALTGGKPCPTNGPSGVMMIPIPRAGLYESVEGLEQARAVPGIEDIVITAKEGQKLVPLPEGATYLGFIFARGETPALAEQALRRSHAELRFQIATVLPTFSPSS